MMIDSLKYAPRPTHGAEISHRKLEVWLVVSPIRYESADGLVTTAKMGDEVSDLQSRDLATFEASGHICRLYQTMVDGKPFGRFPTLADVAPGVLPFTQPPPAPPPAPAQSDDVPGAA